jgi:hypothetical protein
MDPEDIDPTVQEYMAAASQKAMAAGADVHTIIEVGKPDDVILEVAKSDPDTFVVSLDDKHQDCVISVRADVEPELIGAERTEGYASGKIFQPILESLAGPGRMNDSFM